MKIITNVAPKRDNRRKKMSRRPLAKKASVRKPSSKMKDKDIRAEFHKQYSPKHASGAVVIDEFNIGEDTRADIVIASDSLYGLEIKSEADTLDRLPRQILGYDRTCDRPGLIVHESHLAGALELISPWWDVYVASGEIGKVSLTHERKGWTSEELCPSVTLNLLWRRELATAYRRHLALRNEQDSEASSVPISRMHVRQLLRDLAHDVTPEQAIQIAIQLLKERAESGEWFRTYMII